MRKLIPPILLTFFSGILFSCSPAVDHSPSFKHFEISYTNGWTSGFTFVVDTNRIYFSPQKDGVTYYGIASDTIVRMLDTAFLKVRNGRGLTSKDDGCVDCPVLAVKVISGGDTIRITQTGKVDRGFYPIVKALQEFIDNGQHQSIPSDGWFETRPVVVPPVMPGGDSVRFEPR